ncbi:TerD family protein, partial [Streptomyces griseorubiginosus]|uniref:TerD family protein n=1 Tax=Streptomyces griseorubiginosus TaxID=67304 RepID=UPI003327B855
MGAGVDTDVAWFIGGSPVFSVVDSALLLVGGKVRSDADFVFYNQPQHASGSVRH